MSRGQVVTFYSYKGGVGRTFLLVNVASWLAKAGFKILCIDFDLEAPGLHHYFGNQGLLPRPSGKGVRNLLRQASTSARLEWRSLLQPIKIPGAPGPLDLLEAGTASTERDKNTSYSDLYLHHGLGDKLEAAREEWLDTYNLILVDSRTGLTDIGGICAAQLPDILVAVLAPNQQGIDGTLEAVKRAQDERKALPITRGGFQVVPVLGRFDIGANSQQLGKWMSLLTDKLAPLLDEWRHSAAPAEKLVTLLRVPYLSNWSFGEPIPVLASDEPVDDSATVVYAVATVASLLAQKLEYSDQLCMDRDGYVKKVATLGPAIVESDEPDESEAREQFTFDLFLSFSGPELRPVARELAEALKARRFRVFFDEQSIESGKRWREALAAGLEESRGLLALVPESPSNWQRAEVDYFRPFVRPDGERFILPVWMEPRPAWPEIFAFQGFDGRGKSAVEIADLVDAKLRHPSTPEPARQEKPWTSDDALAAYRRHAIERHSKLIPYFAGASDLLLEEVFVRVDVASLPGRMPAEEVVQIQERTKPSIGEPVLLDTLLFPPSQSGPAPRLLLIGDPGAGKTTLCRALTRRLAESQNRVPFFLSLAVIQRSPFEPIRSAAADVLGADTLHTQRGQVLLNALTDAVNSGNAAIFLDGLDEVATEHTDSVIAAIVAFAAENPRTPLVVSGRSIAFERSEFPNHFQRVRVQPLPRERQDELLSKLLSAQDATEVRRHIDRHPALADLAQSPLLLTLLAVVARDTALAETSLPKTRTKLYDTVVTLLLRRGFGIHKQGVRDTQSARRLLQLLSFELHAGGGEAWTQPALSEVLTTLRERHPRTNFLVKETWETNDRFLDDLGRNSGILGPHDSPHLPWRYLHRSLREFLAAEELSTRPEAEVLGYVETWIEEVEVDEKTKRAQALAKHARKSTHSIRGSEKWPDQPPPPSRPDPQRWAEVFAIYAGLATNPSPILDALGQQSPPLALRTLKAIDALPPERLLSHLLQFEGWIDSDLRGLLELWGKTADSAAVLLKDAVRPGLSVQNLGLIWCALEDLGASPDRQDYFTRCGLWPSGGPSLPDLLLIPPSGEALEFMMGSPDGIGEANERPQVRVRVAAFRLGRRTVTWREYNAFRQRAPDFGVPEDLSPSHPATQISWWSAYLYCRWLGGNLPNETQWEGACRAGTQNAYYFGDAPEELSKHAWFEENSGDQPHRSSAEHSNMWALEEMHGNVWEWCLDIHHFSQAGAMTSSSPVGIVPRRIYARAVRGGSYWDTRNMCRAGFRGMARPEAAHEAVGFRVAFPAAPSFDS